MFLSRKETPRHPAREAACHAEWISELNDIRRDIAVARARFDMATEGELIDQCVYELNALQSRYTYFLRLIRENARHPAAVQEAVPCDSC